MTLTLSAATAGRNGSPVVGTGTIVDGAVPTLSVSGPATVKRSGRYDQLYGQSERCKLQRQ